MLVGYSKAQLQTALDNFQKVYDSIPKSKVLRIHSMYHDTYELRKEMATNVACRSASDIVMCDLHEIHFIEKYLELL